MATYYLSSVNGNDTTADGTKALPYATLAAIPLTNGDLILVDSAHSSSEYIVGPDAAAGPPAKLVSIDWTTETYLPGATIRRYSGFSCNGGWQIYGVTMGNRTSGYWCTFGGDNNTDLYLKDCTISETSNATNFIGSSSTTDYLTRMHLEGVKFSGTAGWQFVVDRSAIVKLFGCGLINDPASDGLFKLVRGYLEIDGLDISTMTSGALIQPIEAGRAIIRNTPLPTGVSLLATTGIGSLFAGEVDILYTNPNGSFDRFHREGTVSTSTTVVRNGGAPVTFLGVTPATAIQNRGLPITLDRKILDLSSSRTVRVYFATNGATPLNNDELTLEVHYRKPSTGLGTMLNNRILPIDTPTALPTDNISVWNGLTNPVAQYAEVTIPADVAGDAHAEICVYVCRPNATVYIDPAIEVI